MKTTTVYKASDGKLFENETTALKYEKKLKAAEAKTKREQNLISKRKEISDKPRLEATSPREFIDLIVKYADEYYNIDMKVTGLSFSFGSRICSHFAPIGKKTNRDNRDKGPINYLGWDGRIEGN